MSEFEDPKKRISKEDSTGKERDGFYRVLGVNRDASIEEVNLAAEQLIEPLQGRLTAGDEAALEIVSRIRRARDVLTSSSGAHYKKFTATHPDQDVLSVAVPKSSSQFEAAIDELMPHLMEALRKEPEEIGGRPRGLEGVSDYQQKLWDVLGADAVTASDPEPIFRQFLARALNTHFGGETIIPEALILTPTNRSLITSAVRLVQLSRNPTNTQQTDLDRLLDISAYQYAEAAGLPIMPFRKELFSAAGYSIYSDGNPIPLFQKRLKFRLADLGINIAESADQIPIDPVSSPALALKAISFFELKAGDDNAAIIGRELAKQLGLTEVQEVKYERVPISAFECAFNYSSRAQVGDANELKAVFEDCLILELRKANRTLEPLEFEVLAREIVKESYSRFKKFRPVEYSIDERTFTRTLPAQCGIQSYREIKTAIIDGEMRAIISCNITEPELLADLESIGLNLDLSTIQAGISDTDKFGFRISLKLIKSPDEIIRCFFALLVKGQFE